MRLFRRGASASTLDLLVAGLGNPGREHERDRHNVGWMVVDELGRRCDASFKSKFNGRVSETRIAGSRVALLKPETYMNESGRSIAAAARFFKVAPEDIVVVQRAFDAYRGDKMNHTPLTLLQQSPGAEWVRYDGFASGADLAKETQGMIGS